MSDTKFEAKVKVEAKVKTETGHGFEKRFGSPPPAGMHVACLKKEDNKSLILVKHELDHNTISNLSTSDLLLHKEMLMERQKQRQLESRIATVRGLLDKMGEQQIDMIIKNQSLESQIRERQTLLDEAMEKRSAKEETVKELQHREQETGSDAPAAPEEEVLALETQINSTVGNQIHSLTAIVSSLSTLSCADFLDIDHSDTPTLKSHGTQTGLTEDEWKILNPGTHDIRPIKSKAFK